MKAKLLFIVIAVLCGNPSSAFSQSHFSIEEYEQFLQDNKDLESDVLLARHAAQNPYYRRRDGEISAEAYTYLDSIMEKFQLTQAELRL